MLELPKPSHILIYIIILYVILNKFILTSIYKNLLENRWIIW